MSENDIKPVAWVDLECWKATNDAGESFFTDYQDEETVALYDQSAIDRLSTQLKHYRMAAEAEANLADERGKRIDLLTAERDDCAKAADFLELELAKFQIAADEAKAERDAAMADAERYRWLRDKCNHIGGGLHIQFSSNASEADAAIDAARAQERQG